MADSEIETVLRELLGRQDLSAETREELQEFQSQAQAGKLEAADRAFVVALAKRLGAKSAARAGAGTPANDDVGGYEDDDEGPSWQERALAAEAKLQAFKEAFERTIGGAATLADGPEAQARRELYDQLQQEIERIERGES